MNFISSIFAAEAASSTGTGLGNNSSIIFIVILGVMIVAMVLLTIIPNKRRQKDYQRMQDELRPGTRVMTIGRMIGTVERVNNDNTLEVNVGTPDAPVVITFNREAIGVNLDAQAAAAAAKAVKHQEVAQEEAPKADATEVLGEEKSEIPAEKSDINDDAI